MIIAYILLIVSVLYEIYRGTKDNDGKRMILALLISIATAILIWKTL